VVLRVSVGEGHGLGGAPVEGADDGFEPQDLVEDQVALALLAREVAGA